MQPPQIGILPDPNQVPFKHWQLTELSAWLRMRVPNLEPCIPKKEILILCNQYFVNEYSEETIISPIIKPLHGQYIWQLHLLCWNYCNSLMATDLSSTKAFNRSLAYAMTYL